MSTVTYAWESSVRSLLPIRVELVSYDAKKGRKWELHVWRLNETGVEEGVRR